jgi:hypothetical protein
MPNSGEYLSIIEATLVPVEAAGNPRGAAIDFEMQRQCHTNWCWAAAAASVASYYDPGTTWRQCTVANAELQRSDCCAWPCNVGCVPFNVTNTLASPLNRVGHFEALRFRPSTRAEVVAQLESKRPLLARTAWMGGGAHFVAIVGYIPVEDKVAVRDPFFESSEYEFDRFCNAYSSNVGRWTHSFYTKPK